MSGSFGFIYKEIHNQLSKKEVEEATLKYKNGEKEVFEKLWLIGIERFYDKCKSEKLETTCDFIISHFSNVDTNDNYKILMKKLMEK